MRQIVRAGLQTIAHLPYNSGRIINRYDDIQRHLNNLANDPAHAKVVKEMKSLLARMPQ